MTDLEQVREALEFGRKQGWSPHHKTMWDRGLEDLDAHLKEDAEREAQWELVLGETEAELVALKRTVIERTNEDVTVQEMLDLRAELTELLDALERIVDENGISIVPGIGISPDDIRLAYCKDVARAAIAKAKNQLIEEKE